MKLLWFLILIIFGLNPNVVWSNSTILEISDGYKWDKVASYLHQVMMNDESMKKGYVNLVIVDFTVKHDINGLVEYLNEHSMIKVHLINTLPSFKMKYLDFVIIIQDFMQLNVNKTHFADDFMRKLNALFDRAFMEMSGKYYIINTLDIKMWPQAPVVKYVGKCVNLFRTGYINNILFINHYNSNQFGVIKHYVKNNLIFFKSTSKSNTTYPVAKMGEIDDNNIKLLQYDEPPFLKVENGKLLGSEGKLLDTFCERYNISYTIVNENATDLRVKVFGKLMLKTAMDISFNYILRVTDSYFFESIILNELHDRCLLVPRNIPLSVYDSFTYPFDDKISICLFSVSCLIVISWKAMSLAVKSNFNIDFITFSVFRYLMGNSATLEERMSFKEKFIVYGYVWASFVLLTLYESYVISFMMTDQSYRSVATLEELNNSNTQIYEYYMDGIQFRDDLIVHKMSLNEDNVILKMPDNLDVNMAYLVSNQYADAFIESTRNFDKDGRRLFDKLKENVMSYVPTYTVKKAFPLKKELQFMVTALRESGIKKHWIEQMFNEKQNTIDPVLAKNVVEVVEKIVLSFSDMKVPFVILGIGMTLSFVFFIIEHIYHVIKRNGELRTNSIDFAN